MELYNVQRALNARGWKPALLLDGKWGSKTRGAITAQLDKLSVRYAGWSPARLQLAGKQLVAKWAEIEVGEIDGLLGPSTRYALEVWEARQRGDKSVETWRDDLPPAPPPNPKIAWPSQASVRKFYGEPGLNQTMLVLPYAMKLAWDLKTAVKRISIHEMCHDSAKRVLERVADTYTPEQIAKIGLDLFGGCLNVRKMRGGSALSMHAWGIAIDVDPDRNQIKWGRDRARLAQPDAALWWKLWEEEGWVSLGRRSNFDWMHVQAAQP